MKIDAFGDKPHGQGVSPDRRLTTTSDAKASRASQRTFTGTVNSISPASGAEFALLPPDNAYR